jgi:hypothetical protein
MDQAPAKWPRRKPASSDEPHPDEYLPYRRPASVCTLVKFALASTVRRAQEMTRGECLSDRRNNPEYGAAGQYQNKRRGLRGDRALAYFKKSKITAQRLP